MIRAVDLFAGAGGTSTGLIRAADGRRLDLNQVALLWAAKEDARDIRSGGPHSLRDLRLAEPVRAKLSDASILIVEPLLNRSALPDPAERAIRLFGFGGQVWTELDEQGADLAGSCDLPDVLALSPLGGLPQDSDCADAKAPVNGEQCARVGVHDGDLDAEMALPEMDAALSVEVAGEPRREQVIGPIVKVQFCSEWGFHGHHCTPRSDTALGTAEALCRAILEEAA